MEANSITWVSSGLSSLLFLGLSLEKAWYSDYQVDNLEVLLASMHQLYTIVAFNCYVCIFQMWVQT